MKNTNETNRSNAPVISFSYKATMQDHATIIELYYTGDSISKKNLAAQFGITRRGLERILSKYYPRQGTRNIVILLQSKINDMWGESDITSEDKIQESQGK